MEAIFYIFIGAALVLVALGVFALRRRSRTYDDPHYPTNTRTDISNDFEAAARDSRREPGSTL